MASKGGVAVGTIPTSSSGTVDLTVSGFGTVSAAVVVITRANTTNNPQDGLRYSVGFWDGVNSVQHCCSILADDNVSTTVADRWHDSALIGRISSETFTCSATTNGITITNVGGSSVAYYVEALLIGGATDVHLATQSLGTGTGAPVDITAPGFKPTAVFLSTVGLGAVGTAIHAILSIGVAHNNSSDVVSQGAMMCFSEDALASVANNGSYATDTYCCGQYFSDALSWGATAGSFDTSGFSLTPNASAGNDIVSYLAIQLPDADDFWVDIIDSAASTGNSSTTGLGFQPDAVGFTATPASALGTSTGSIGLFVGMGDSASQRAMWGTDLDGAATSDAASEANLSAVLNGVFGNNVDDYVASLSTLDSDGFTLNYSDASVTPKKILAFAIGDSTAGGGGPSVNINGSTVSWNGLTSYNWNGIA